MSEQINVLKWIDEYTSTTALENNELCFIRDYTLLWHLFEKQHFDKFFRVEGVSSVIDRASISDINKYTQCLEYFKDRYINDNETNNKFNNLHLTRNNNSRTSPYELLVKNVLMQNTSNIKDIIKAMVYIVARYRNNLFHGEKNLVNINDQKRNFEVANRFLMILMDDLK